MKRTKWIAAALVLAVSLAAGCSNSSTNSKPTTAAPAGPPKGGESNTNAGKGGLENPPPP
jgi:hypothetical protein